MCAALTELALGLTPQRPITREKATLLPEESAVSTTPPEVDDDDRPGKVKSTTSYLTLQEWKKALGF
ncbi:unnamed protein product [Strongylus vulgaris]|uniref:Uncharacterized protein n=1 Tax=Strongylus vulgaris TaxID=40348 RepID=A0A3P7ITQ3_STRVU|nr:unnamed protein product [Strongylus vulgaris]